MNKSGQSVGEAIRFYKLEPDQILIIYDELDLAPGKIRMKLGGGHGGHNGIRDIHAHIGPHYRRLRIGVGHPGSKEQVTGHVLSNFAKADQSWLDPLLDAISSEIPWVVKGDEARFSTAVALKLGKDKKDKEQD
jgi:PTH1 family peptidyl-tRNA hydrolase